MTGPLDDGRILINPTFVRSSDARVFYEEGGCWWWAPLRVRRRSGGIAHKRNGLEGQLAAREKLLPKPGRMCRQLEGGQLSVMNVCLDREEQVVAAGVVPVFDRRPHGTDPPGHQLICLTRTRK
jgi:hypothetical protein